VIDWRKREPSNCARFPFVLAADVTYDRSHLDPLLDVLEERLAPSGQAWFGDAGRSPAPDFSSRAKARGWLVECFDELDEPVNELRLGQFARLVLTRET
jgi:hypothetical protein